MSSAPSAKHTVPSNDKISVITNAVLLTRRVRELQRRRDSLMAKQEQLRTQLPDWAIEPLRLVGMTGDEIRSLVNDLSAAETEVGLDEIEQHLEQIDRQVEDLETMLVNTPSSSLEEVETVLGLAVTRFREIIVTDPEDVFYDHGEARLLSLIERIHEDFAGLLRETRLSAG